MSELRNKRYNWPDNGYFALAASYLHENASVNAYCSSPVDDVANAFVRKTRNFTGEFVVVRAKDLIIYRVPSTQVEIVRGRIS